jgi:hypothetical protein
MIDIPLMKNTGSKSPKLPWDYDTRMTVLWVHILASAYHWSLDDINQLWPEDAAAYIEEIFVDEQLEREWQHSMTTLAYKYDKKGKGTLVPLVRPSWMRKSGGPKATRIPRRLIPTGTIIDLSGVPQGGPSGLS